MKPIKIFSRLKKAGKDGDARNARAALKAWAKAHWPDFPIPALGDIAGRLNSSELASEFNRRDQYPYAESATASMGESRHPVIWSGAELLRLLSIISGIKSVMTINPHSIAAAVSRQGLNDSINSRGWESNKPLLFDVQASISR